MPSISDVFNQLVQANNVLQQIHNDDTAIKTAVDGVKASADAVKNSVDQVNNRLQNLIAGQTYSNQALFHLSQQLDTLICTTEKISKNTCGILTEVHIQTGLQRGILSASSDALEIAKYAHPDAALELSRLQALQREIEKCCPPPVPEPACTYQPCKAPEHLKPPQQDDRAVK